MDKMTVKTGPGVFDDSEVPIAWGGAPWDAIRDAEVFGTRQDAAALLAVERDLNAQLKRRNTALLNMVDRLKTDMLVLSVIMFGVGGVLGVLLGWLFLS